ncbi:MAG: hypothetical protein B7Z37_22830 [Verrucomicrobia bacterium 12-59-8]|nr:MAG: hypothetical protein B7Z37_22830 [Verrucomicrobia bacterium 12-59-8]
MSAYLVTRDGQELGSFEIPQILAGLKTGFLQASDWGWREGMSGWEQLSEIVRTTQAPLTKTISSPLSAPVKRPAEVKLPDGLNPYAAPISNIQAATSSIVPPNVIKELTGTKPWVRLLSVLMWLGCSVFLVFIVINLVFGLRGGSTLIQSGAAGAGLAYMIGSTVGYCIMALLIIYPTMKLSKYASKIGRLADSRTFIDLAAALAEQRRFWKFYGILTLIYLSLAALFVGLVLAGVGMGSIPR